MSIADKLTEEIIKRLFIQVEASGRHVHLCRADADYLFGENYQLTPVKLLSQPGQFACKERVKLMGEKGSIDGVVVLGPERPETQVEISLTDARALGIKSPVRLSGDIKNTPGIGISFGGRTIHKNQGVIVAKRHIHMSEEDAERFNITDGDKVKLKVFGERSVTFNETVVRVNRNFATFAHIDYDEANACGFSGGMLGLLIK